VNGMWDDGDHNFNVLVAGSVAHDSADLAAAGWAGVVVFTEHAPSEFEAGSHYLRTRRATTWSPCTAPTTYTATAATAAAAEVEERPSAPSLGRALW
jgi:hypothetical protein